MEPEFEGSPWWKLVGFPSPCQGRLEVRHCDFEKVWQWKNQPVLKVLIPVTHIFLQSSRATKQKVCKIILSRPWFEVEVSSPFSDVHIIFRYFQHELWHVQNNLLYSMIAMNWIIGFNSIHVLIEKKKNKTWWSFVWQDKTKKEPPCKTVLSWFDLNDNTNLVLLSCRTCSSHQPCLQGGVTETWREKLDSVVALMWMDQKPIVSLLFCYSMIFS